MENTPAQKSSGLASTKSTIIAMATLFSILGGCSYFSAQQDQKQREKGAETKKSQDRVFQLFLASENRIGQHPIQFNISSDDYNRPAYLRTEEGSSLINDGNLPIQLYLLDEKHTIVDTIYGNIEIDSDQFLKASK